MSWIKLNATTPAAPGGAANVHFRKEAGHAGTESDPIPTSAFYDALEDFQGYATGSSVSIPAGSSAELKSVARVSNVVTVETMTAHGFSLGNYVFMGGGLAGAGAIQGPISDVDTTHFSFSNPGPDDSISNDLGLSSPVFRGAYRLEGGVFGTGAYLVDIDDIGVQFGEPIVVAGVDDSSFDGVYTAQGASSARYLSYVQDPGLPVNVGSGNGMVASVSGGKRGAVPAPGALDSTKFLRGDGTWATAGGGGGILADDLAARPAAGTEGRIFIPIDQPVGQPDFFWDSGEAWIPFVNFRPLYPPAGGQIYLSILTVFGGNHV